LDIIATDHAPHTWDEKQQSYSKAPSGLPLVQHSLQMMLQYVHDGTISIEQVVNKMCHCPAICFNIKDRGYLREGYFADIVIADMHSPYTINKSNILYKCGWSPLEGTTFNSSINYTIVNGNIVFENGKVNDTIKGMRLAFDRA
jgi:dihydroorotase